MNQIDETKNVGQVVEVEILGRKCIIIIIEAAHLGHQRL